MVFIFLSRTYCIRLVFLVVLFLSAYYDVQGRLPEGQMGLDRADSLYHAITSMPDDTSKVNRLNEYGLYFIDYLPDSSGLVLARKALSLSEKLHYDYGKPFALSHMGTYYWYNGYYPKARNYYCQAIELAEPYGEHRLIAETTNRLALVYYYQARYDSAEMYHHRALPHFRALGDSLGVARIWRHLGLLNYKRTQYSLAVEYYLKAMDKYEVYGTLLNRARMFNDLGKVYLALGEDDLAWAKKDELLALVARPHKIDDQATYLELAGDFYYLLNEYDSALAYYDRAHKALLKVGKTNYYDYYIREKVGKIFLSRGDYEEALRHMKRLHEARQGFSTRIHRASSLGNIAEVYRKSGNWPKAITYYSKTLHLHLEMGNTLSIAKTYRSLAKTYLAAATPSKAIKNAMLGLETASPIEALSVEVDLLKVLSDAYHQLGNYQRAADYLKQHYIKKEAMTRSTTLQKISRLRVKYQVEKNQREISQLRQKEAEQAIALRQRNLVVTIFVILCLFILALAVLLYYRYQLKAKSNVLLMQKNQMGKMMLAEIHHRIKNNLQLISSLLSMQNRRVSEPKSKEILNITQNRVKSIGLIHEHLYQHNNLSLIQLNLYVEKLIQMLVDSLYSGTVQPKITLKADAIKTTIDLAISIGLILNELVTNAIKYGLSNNPAPELIIILTQSENMINIKVSDNGPGVSEFKTGFGWTIITTTLENINGTVKTESKDGFTANLSFQIKEEI